MSDDKYENYGLRRGPTDVLPVGTGLGPGTIAGTTVGGLGTPMAPVTNDATDMEVNASDALMHNDDIIDTLNNLIETCYDGEYGFRACTERTKSQNLKSVFQERMRDCSSSAAELASEVVRLGGTPEDSGSVGGTVHRGWVAVRDMLTSDSDNDLAILEECERGEDTALARYRKAQKEALPFNIRAIVERQMQGVQKNHDMIKQLRDSHKLQS